MSGTQTFAQMQRDRNRHDKLRHIYLVVEAVHPGRLHVCIKVATDSGRQGVWIARKLIIQRRV